MAPLVALGLLLVACLVAGGGIPRRSGGLIVAGTNSDKHVNVSTLTVGLLVPHTNFGLREYTRAVNTAIAGLNKARATSKKMDFLKRYHFNSTNVHTKHLPLTPSPKGMVFFKFLAKGVTAV